MPARRRRYLALHDNVEVNTSILADVARCLSIASGLLNGSADDLARLDVESGNAGVDLSDALRLARKGAGLEANP